MSTKPDRWPGRSELVIRSEQQAFDVLKLAVDGKLEPTSNIRFDGWPKLNIRLTGDLFHQSLTPTVMRGLLEFQRAFYQSYSEARYNTPNKRLTEEEKRALEIRVDVGQGSTDLEINFQELAVRFIERIGDKMDQTGIIIVILSVALMYFGSTAIRAFLDNRKEIKLREISDETLRHSLEATKFLSMQDKEKMQILADAATKEPKIRVIGELAYGAHIGVVKSTVRADSSTIENIEVAPDMAKTLTSGTRQLGKQVRLDGNYRILKLDWSDPTRMRVKVFSTQLGIELDADVEDETMDGKYKEAIRQAEWSRKTVSLSVNAKLFGEADYREAVILDAKST